MPRRARFWDIRGNPRGIDLMIRHGHALVVLRWARARHMFNTISTKGPYP